jgi:hypothetical protein
MVNFKKLQKQCPDGIPFSKCKEYLKKHKKKTHKRSKKKKPIKKTSKIPPKNVIIRKKDKLYKSNGRKLTPLVN